MRRTVIWSLVSFVAAGLAASCASSRNQVSPTGAGSSSSGSTSGSGNSSGSGGSSGSSSGTGTSSSGAGGSSSGGTTICGIAQQPCCTAAVNQCAADLSCVGG